MRRCIYRIQTSERMQHLTIIQDKLHSFNIQDDQWWAFCETVQKISKITQYTASRFSLLTSAKFAAVREVVGCLNEHQQSYASTQ